MTKIVAAKRLKGLLPICSYCKRIRGNGERWERLEDYITEHSEAEFSHGVCPECREKILEAKLADLLKSRSALRRRKETHSHTCVRCGNASPSTGKKVNCVRRIEKAAADTQRRDDT